MVGFESLDAIDVAARRLSRTRCWSRTTMSTWERGREEFGESIDAKACVSVAGE